MLVPPRRHENHELCLPSMATHLQEAEFYDLMEEVGKYWKVPRAGIRQLWELSRGYRVSSQHRAKEWPPESLRNYRLGWFQGHSPDHLCIQDPISQGVIAPFCFMT